MPGIQEMIVIAVVVLLLFGGRKLPELARGLALALREFKNASRDIKEEVKDATDDINDSINK